MNYVTVGYVAGGFIFLTIIFKIMISLRCVVSTNEVHIVQSSKKTTSYGTGLATGNTYYAWPSWMPIVGVSNTVLPTSVFNLFLKDYEAYDNGRLPFSVDVMAFFRIEDSNLAAQRVADFDELFKQLNAIVQGAVRTVLANSDIEEIMVQRSKFGDAFTKEVNGELKNWGVITVKNLELMDLRDGTNGQAIHNIMSKKKSHIEMQSRAEVAKNNRDAEIAEIEAQRQVDLGKQEAAQQVGIRTVENNRQVQIAQQEASQLVKEQERVTKEKEMAVTRAAEIKKAEIDRDKAVIAAEQSKQVTILAADGSLEAAKLAAQGTRLAGEAKADAEKAFQMASVQSQTTLAEKIGANKEYQSYLITLRQIEAGQAVGMKQAEAIKEADIKIIVNAGTVNSGVKDVMDIFSPKGGTAIGAMLEGLAQTDLGKAALRQIGVTEGPAVVQ